MNTSWTPLIKAALPSIAASVLLALGAPAQASLITLSTGFSAAGPLGSAAAYKSTVEAAVASPTTGYGSMTLSSFDNISNHGLFGSNSNVAFDFTVSFNVDAVDAGLQVKINTTLMAEMNDNQILPLLDFAYGLGSRYPGTSLATEGRAANHGIVVRFLELMAMGHLHGSAGRRLVTTEQILAGIRRRHEITGLGRKYSDTAAYYRLDRGQIFGIIANSSAPFCADCDRLRLDALGRVYGCLSNANGFALEGAAETATVLSQAMALKQKQQFTGSELKMREVGG